MNYYFKYLKYKQKYLNQLGGGKASVLNLKRLNLFADSSQKTLFLDPTFGFIMMESHAIKNYFLYAMPSNYKKLIQNLFTKIPGAIAPSKSDQSIGDVLTPYAIGQLLAIMYWGTDAQLINVQLKDFYKGINKKKIKRKKFNTLLVSAFPQKRRDRLLYGIFLALLWCKATNKEGFKQFYQGYNDKAPETQRVTIPTSWDDFTMAELESEDLSLRAILAKTYFLTNSSLELFQQEQARVQWCCQDKCCSSSYADCGATSLRNFFRILIRTNTLDCDVSILRKMGASSSIIDFFTTYNTHVKQAAKEARNAWGKLTCNHPGVVYKEICQNQDCISYCEVKSGWDTTKSKLNILVLINSLFPQREIKSWVDVASLCPDIFKLLDNDIDEEFEYSPFGILKFEVNAHEYWWYLDNGHFYIKEQMRQQDLTKFESKLDTSLAKFYFYSCIPFSIEHLNIIYRESTSLNSLWFARLIKNESMIIFFSQVISNEILYNYYFLTQVFYWNYDAVRRTSVNWNIIIKYSKMIDITLLLLPKFRCSELIRTVPMARHIRYLHLDWNSRLSQVNLTKILGSTVNLVELISYSNIDFTNINLPKLKNLSVNSLINLEATTTLNNLKVLKISNIPNNNVFPTHFSSLEVLDIGFNMYHSLMLQNLSNLKCLKLSSRIEFELGTSLHHLNSLEDISIYCRVYNSPLDIPLQGLTKLQKIKFTYISQFNRPIPSYLTNLTSLILPKGYNNPLPSLPKLIYVKYLNLNLTNLTDRFPNLKQLEKIDFTSVSTTQNFTTLKIIQIPIEKINIDLSGLANLENLTIYGKINNCILPSLSELANLKILNLKVEFKTLQFNPVLQKLEELNILSPVNPELLNTLSGKLPSLKRLILREYNSTIDLPNLFNLEELNLGYYFNEVLTKLINFNNLKKLIIDYPEFSHSLNGLPISIKYLELYGRTFKNLKPLSNLINLEEIKFLDNVNITNLKPLLKCTKLKKIIIGAYAYQGVLLTELLNFKIL